MAGKLDGKGAIVTGAAANIGAATAKLFAAEGAKLVLADIDEATEHTAASIRDDGGQAVFVRTDLTDEGQVEALANQADEKLESIDAMVNNAGLQRSGWVNEFPASEWDALMMVNPRSCFLMAKHVSPLMSDGGSIINTSSLAGLKGGPGLSGYSASKGAIIGFSRSLAMELAPRKIRVNTLCPGWVDTAFNDPAIELMGGPKAQAQAVDQMVPLKRQAVPEEIAQAMLFLASDMSSYMTGQSLFVDGGVY
jgi:NAD(P)-dependent dehydrogenase (short-subunit alcohol dehydrogenase family)